VSRRLDRIASSRATLAGSACGPWSELDDAQASLGCRLERLAAWRVR
jgi:hypothetical protein